ncbi:MAG: efflux RND transporter periplasmic adaptor subunit [Mucilaginibacter sp.]
MKATYKKILIIAGVVSILFLAWFFFFRTPKKTIVLQSEKPTRGYIATSVTATGKIEPVDTVAVGTQVSGILRYLYVDFNTKVKKGQLIAALDKSLLQATLDQYKGNLQNAISQMNLQKNNYERQSLLFKTDAISKADYDNALYGYTSAKAQVAANQAAVRSAQKNLAYADIYSPIDGVILNRNISVGQTVAASFNTPTLFIIAKDITKMQVQANVDEADIGGVTKGERVTFTVDAFINDSFNGMVEDIRLHPSVSANVVTYTTIINAPNNDMKLKPGMTANIIIYTKEVNNALLIPAKALTFTPDSSMAKDYIIREAAAHKGTNKKSATGSNAPHNVKSRNDSTSIAKQKAFVWLLSGKTLTQKRIEIGLNDDQNVEVLRGLTANDVIVTGIAAGKASAASATSAGSPFIPKRGGGGGRSR